MQIPPRVGEKWPSRLVPPEYAVIGSFLSWHTFTILLTSSVLKGRTIRKGFSMSLAVYEDHSDPEWCWRSVSVVETLSLPTISTKSVHEAWRFVGEVSCTGAIIEDRGAVDTGEGGAGFLVPNM